MSHCPVCGHKLLSIAKGYFDGEDDAIVSWAKIKPAERISFHITACPKCEVLYLTPHGVTGFHFEVVGSLTSEFTTILVAAGLRK